MKTGGPRLTKEAKVTVLGNLIFICKMYLTTFQFSTRVCKYYVLCFQTEKPHFEKTMQVETVGEFGREITIPCNLHGVPRPNVTWFRNGKPLSETPNIRFSVGSNGDSNTSEKQINAQGQKRKTTSTTDLKINFLRLEDSGMFQCSASNAAGDLVGYTWLRVKSKYIQIIESYRYYFISMKLK